jgi:hypothetical protein
MHTYSNSFNLTAKTAKTLMQSHKSSYKQPNNSHAHNQCRFVVCSAVQCDVCLHSNIIPLYTTHPISPTSHHTPQIDDLSAQMLDTSDFDALKVTLDVCVFENQVSVYVCVCEEWDYGVNS